MELDSITSLFILGTGGVMKGREKEEKEEGEGEGGGEEEEEEEEECVSF